MKERNNINLFLLEIFHKKGKGIAFYTLANNSFNVTQSMKMLMLDALISKYIVIILVKNMYFLCALLNNNFL